MEKLNNFYQYKFILIYALRDLKRNYKKISSIIITLFISLFILSAIFTIEDSLKKELKENAKELLGGDLEIDYNRNQGNIDLLNKVEEFTTISEMVEFSTMLSTTNRKKNKSLFTRIKTVDQKYPLYGEVTYEPADAYERMQTEPYTILINESLSKTLNIKTNETEITEDATTSVNNELVPQPLKLHTAGIVGNTGTHGEESLYQSTPINFTHEGKLATEHTLKFISRSYNYLDPLGNVLPEANWTYTDTEITQSSIIPRRKRVGDITYGKEPVISTFSNAVFFGTTTLGYEESDLYPGPGPDFSFVKLEKAFVFDSDTDKIIRL